MGARQNRGGPFKAFFKILKCYFMITLISFNLRLVCTKTQPFSFSTLVESITVDLTILQDERNNSGVPPPDEPGWNK